MKLVPLFTENKVLTPRRSKEERLKKYTTATQRYIQHYIKDGSKGDLELKKTPITSLPDNLTKVGGTLTLSGTRITSLPDNLKVGGNLQLDHSLITSLPDNLEVGGYLNLYKTQITSLPSNLEVEKWLILNYTPLSKKYTEQEIRQMVPGVKGGIRLSY